MKKDKKLPIYNNDTRLQLLISTVNDMALLSFSRKLNAELEAKTASLIKEAEDVLVLAHAVYKLILIR
jgi:hypothetical protein